MRLRMEEEMDFKLVCMGLGALAWRRPGPAGENTARGGLEAPACPGSCHHCLGTNSLPPTWSPVRAIENLVLRDTKLSRCRPPELSCASSGVLLPVLLLCGGGKVEL